MDIQEYKAKKLEKISKQIVTKINNLPTFGYEPEIDALAKQAITLFLWSITSISNIREEEIDIITQSILDDLGTITRDILGELLELSRAK